MQKRGKDIGIYKVDVLKKAANENGGVEAVPVPVPVTSKARGDIAG